MTAGESIRLFLGALCLAGGLLALITAIVGNFRFRDVLPRMHAAGVGDTLGVFLTFSGITVLCGISAFTLKLLIVLLLFWVSNPVLSHLILRMEMRRAAPENEKTEGKDQ